MEVGRLRDMMANEHITVGSNSFEKVKIIKCKLQSEIHVITESRYFVFSTSLEVLEN